VAGPLVVGTLITDREGGVPAAPLLTFVGTFEDGPDATA
jgi:hypothetical protein